MTWPFGNLQMFRYGAIIADPPWNFEFHTPAGQTAKSVQAQYGVMDDGEILSLPVGSLASADCVLWLWTTWPRVDFAMKVLKTWGFRYVTGGAWVKATRSGKLRIGTGYTLRSACEPFFIGRMGDNQARLTDVANVIIEEAREHSRKPDAVRRIVERMTPNAYRVELFAREPWHAGDVWGDEVDKFEAAE